MRSACAATSRPGSRGSSRASKRRPIRSSSSRSSPAALAISGSFVWLAVVSTLARMIVYAVTIAALPRAPGRRHLGALHYVHRRGRHRGLRLGGGPGRRQGVADASARSPAAGVLLYAVAETGPAQAPVEPLLQRVEQRQLARQHHRPRLLPASSSAPRRPRESADAVRCCGGHSHSNSIASDRRRIEFAFDREGLDHLAAGLANRRERKRDRVERESRFLPRIRAAPPRRALRPRSTMPLGIIQAPASLPCQNGPPGLISRTSVAPSRGRERGGCRRYAAAASIVCDAAAVSAIQPPPSSRDAVVEHRRLARRDAIFGAWRSGPTRRRSVAGTGRRERAHLHADFALLLADPVPVARPASPRPPARGAGRRPAAACSGSMRTT